MHTKRAVRQTASTLPDKSDRKSRLDHGAAFFYSQGRRGMMALVKSGGK